MSQHTDHSHSTTSGPGYETADVHVAPITRFMVGLVALMFVGAILAAISFYLLNLREQFNRAEMKTTAIQETRQVPSGPLLQVSNHDDLLSFREQESKDVQGHATWLDKNAKVVRLPIERAIELVSERGLPEYKGDVSAAPAEPAPAGVSKR